jgi:hypothetical protein
MLKKAHKAQLRKNRLYQLIQEKPDSSKLKNLTKEILTSNLDLKNQEFSRKVLKAGQRARKLPYYAKYRENYRNI